MIRNGVAGGCAEHMYQDASRTGSRLAVEEGSPVEDKKTCRFLLVSCALVAATVLPLRAQQEPPDKTAAQTADEGTTEATQDTTKQATDDPTAQAASQSPDPAAGRSGYASGPPTLEGPDSVPSEIATDDIDVGAVWKPGWFDGVLDPWWALKKNLNESVGLKLHLSYQTLRQSVDHSPGEDTGAAYRVQIQGMWTLVNRKGKNPG